MQTELGTKLHTFFIECYFCLREWLEDTLQFIQTQVFGKRFSLKWIKWAWHFKEKLTISVANDRIWAFEKKNGILENLNSTQNSLTASQFLKTFLTKLMIILMNVIC